MKRILITGANGFLGQALTHQLISEHRPVRIVTRCLQEQRSDMLETKQITALDENTDWAEVVKDISVIIHCAARVHVMNENSSDPLEEFRRVNVRGTLNLARQAAASGVRRFIFISSIGVNGSETVGTPFTADDVATPNTPYSISKWEAEQELLALSKVSGLEVVIIRPPLIYGPAAPGNFAQLMRAINLGIPLPFGMLSNKRSYVAIDNVVDLIIRCIDHDAAKNQVFLVSDGVDLSTTELIRRIAKAQQKTIFLLPIPTAWLYVFAKLVRREAQIHKICCSLEIDIKKTTELLMWHPIISIDDALHKTVIS